MKKKTAFLCAFIMLLTAGCGKLDVGSDTDEETTAASTEAETTEAASEAEKTEVSEKFGTEFELFPDIELGMTEAEVQAVIGDNYERSVEKYLDINPDIVYYTVPMDSCPFLGIDMEGYELFTFIPDGELISMSCHFGVIDRDNNTSKEHSEEEIKAVYDKLFDQIHEYYGDYYTSTDVGAPSLGNLSWDNTYGHLTLWGTYYDDTKEGNVSLSLNDSSFAQKILDYTKGNANSQSPNNGQNILSQLKTGMSEEDVFAVIGKDYDYEYSAGYKPSVEYDYSFAADEVFNTGLGGYIFVEFDEKNNELTCFGYHIGAVGHVEDHSYPYSESELEEAFNKLLPYLEEEYGNADEPSAFSGEGVKAEYSWSMGTDQLWAIWGTDLWGASSGVNEIIVSRSIDR